jgi:transglutaminase/protease-like cytokinesis protein 3
MKKSIIIILFFSLSSIAYSQNNKIVDSLVLTYPKSFSSSEKLAEKISIDFRNEYDKVRAIYVWITNNISYDFSEKGAFNYEYSTKDERIKKEIKHNKKLSKRVISKGKAVCEGYSVLFNSICENLNIDSKIVLGNAKADITDIGKRYNSNHAWNIVVINDEKYLIDTTWGAGFYQSRFVKQFDNFYFQTDPELFIKTHYPDDFRDSLLSKKVEKEEFLNSPMFFDYKYELVNPIDGLIKIPENKIIEFEFTSENSVVLVSCNINEKHFIEPEYTNENNKVKFEINLADFPRAKELVVHFNFEPIIGFKLK